MSANIIFVHDDPEFIRGAAVALRLAGHEVITFQEPMEALSALETAQFDILITRVQFPVGQPNGVALARMARVKQPLIKVVFTVAAENVEYTEGLGKAVTAPIDVVELLAVVAKLAADRGAGMSEG
jgi:DNA-binding NtrC family response regulator